MPVCDPARSGSSLRSISGSSISPREAKTPRVVELLRKAMEWQSLMDSGQITSQADIARREGITRARVSQVMGLLRLAPEHRARILAMPITARRPAITERILRPKTVVADRGSAASSDS